MGKKDYQLFADAISLIENEGDRKRIINFLEGVFFEDNNRFDSSRFQDWIDRWREAVLARDNWTCQKYGIKGGRLHSHHIQNFAQYPELRFAIDNGITFSDKAHKEFHKKYGIKNNTKKQIEEFIK